MSLPLDINTVFEQSWTGYKRRFVPITVLAAALMLPVLAMNLLTLLEGLKEAPRMLLSWSAVIWQLSAILILAGLIAPSCTPDDKPNTPQELYELAAQGALRVAKAGTLILIALYLPFFVAAILTLIALLIFGQGELLYLVPPVVIMPFIFVASPAAHIEGLTATRALKRAHALSRGTRAQLFYWSIGLIFCIYLVDASTLILELLLSTISVKETTTLLMLNTLPVLLSYLLAFIIGGFFATLCATTYHALIIEEQHASSAEPF